MVITIRGASLRIDKWLQVARVFKTRSLATRACNLGHVKVNGAVIKPHRALALGDRVEVRLSHDWSRTLIVKELRDKPLRKAEVPTLFEDLSPPRPRLDAVERALRKAPASRDRGQGRPTKRERRDLERWKGR